MKKVGLFTAAVVAWAGMSIPSYANTVEFRMGQTKHITAYRGFRCGSPAPAFGDVMKRIPKSKLVKYSDGGLSSRVSKQCKTRVPTRAINGTAIKSGKETKRYQSGTVTLVVR